VRLSQQSLLHSAEMATDKKLMGDSYMQQQLLL